jgi:hypothetical protein
MPNFEALQRIFQSKNPPIPAPGLAAPASPQATMPVPPPQASAPEGFLSNPASYEKKGGLPIEMILQVQKVYQTPEPQVNAQGQQQQGLGLKPGWGGKGR